MMFLRRRSLVKILLITSMTMFTLPFLLVWLGFPPTLYGVLFTLWVGAFFPAIAAGILYIIRNIGRWKVESENAEAAFYSPGISRTELIMITIALCTIGSISIWLLYANHYSTSESFRVLEPLKPWFLVLQAVVSLAGGTLIMKAKKVGVILGFATVGLVLIEPVFVDIDGVSGILGVYWRFGPISLILLLLYNIWRNLRDEST